MSAPIVLVEMNELCPDLLRKWMAAGQLPNFKKFFESSKRGSKSGGGGASNGSSGGGGSSGKWSPPTPDEEPKEMRRAQKTDLRGGEVELEPRKRVQRAHTTRRHPWAKRRPTTSSAVSLGHLKYSEKNAGGHRFMRVGVTPEASICTPVKRVLRSTWAIRIIAPARG